MSTHPPHDERVLAALAHASAIANIANLAGLIATMLIYATQREKSEYVRIHALQALIYQGVNLLIGLGLLLLSGLCMAVSLVPVMLRPDLYSTGPPGLFWIALLSLMVPLMFGALTTLYALYAAVRAYRGQALAYPLIGRLVHPPAAPDVPPVSPEET